ncbi:hypothetical protein ON010_g105 [Phytophthora cinnamomi]|nr:hypothetical protein ON010_g105 [Phytophthora cinnamomi]
MRPGIQRNAVSNVSESNPDALHVPPGALTPVEPCDEGIAWWSAHVHSAAGPFGAGIRIIGGPQASVADGGIQPRKDTTM